MKNNYILYNGEFLLRDSFPVSAPEWLQLSGQMMRISLFASGNRIPFLEPHLSLLTRQFFSIGWELPGSFEPATLKSKFEKLLNRNRLFKGSRIHWFIIPGLSSGHVPGIPEFRYLAFTEGLEHDHFPLNQKGLSIGISKRFMNSGDPYYSSMVRSSIRSILIRQEAMENNWNEIILTDPQGNLSEILDGNLFIRFGNDILVPSAATNTLPRVMSGIVRDICRQAGFTLSESDELCSTHLIDADEIFISDDLNGIRWVLSFEKKRYYRKAAVTISDELNRLVRRTDQFHMGSSG